MTNLLPLADQLATKSLQWFLVFTLLVLGVLVIFAVRWLVNKYEKAMDAQRADQQQYSTNLLNITADQNKTARDLAVVLDRCATALEDSGDHMRLCREVQNNKQH